MKKFKVIIKWFLLPLIFLITLYFSVCFAIYRIPSSQDEVTFEAEIHYKFFELNLNNRAIFEDFLNNRVARLIGQPILYVNQQDHSRLWPENPHDLFKKNYTYSAKLSAKPLLFGGYGLANVIYVKK